MTKKPSISAVPQTTTNTVTINNNFSNIREAFDNTLSLDGSTPNAMQADLDMDGNDIINAGNIFVDGVDYEELLRSLAEDAADSEEAAATHASNASDSADSAENSASLAQEWAENPEDDAVTGHPGQYSALHHATKAAASASAAAASSAAAGAASGRLDIGAFSELGTKFVYADPGEGQQLVAEGDVVLWRGTNHRFLVGAADAIDAPFDYTGSGGVTFYDLNQRSAQVLTLYATAPDGTVFWLAGRWYEVDSTQTGTDSCANDLSIDGIKPWGTAHPEHWGIDTTGATDVTTLLDRMWRWCIENSMPMDFDGCTTLISATFGPLSAISGNMRLLPGNWSINVTGDADPADHVCHTELNGGNSINECNIAIDCNDRIAGGFWIRQNVAGGVAQNRGFVKFSDGLQRNAAATTENAAWAYFGPFLYADAGQGLVEGMNRVLNSNSAATSGVLIAGALGYKAVEGWTIKNIGADTMQPRITITNITQANPAVVTAAGHGLITGAQVQIRADNLGGASMTEIQSSTPRTVTVIDANTFSLDGVDSTGYTAFTGTGYAVHAIYDFDGVKIFGAAGATTFAQRDGAAAVRNCWFENCVGRAVKLQSKGRVDDCMIRIDGVPIIPDFTAIDGQIGPVLGRGNRFEFLTGAGVDPFLTGLSASAVAMQMQETDNVMDPAITDSVLVCGSELPRFATVITITTMLDGAALVDGVRGLREDGYSGDLLRDGLLYFDAGNVVTSGSAFTATVRGADGPFGAPMIAYIGYTSGSVAGLFMEVTNCRNTGTFVRAISNPSGSQITDMTRFRLWENDEFNHLYGSVSFDFKDLPAYTQFDIIQGSGTHTNAPSDWGSFSGTVFGTVRTWSRLYGSALCSAELDVEVDGDVVVTYKTKQGTSAARWQEFRAVEQQEALSASVPASPSGGAIVDAEARVAIDGLRTLLNEIVTDLTAANIHAT